MPDKRQKLLRIAEIDQSPKQAILNMYEVHEQDVEAIMMAIYAMQEEVEYHVENKVNGKDGKDGADGYTPVKGLDYFDGKDGKNGKDGRDGMDGKDGYTPVKGVDYFDGVDGEKGEQGEKGDIPDHEIKGHFIRFEKPDGEWGDWIKVGGEASNVVRGTLSQMKVKQSGTVVGNQVKEINFVGATVTGNKDSVTVTITPGSSSLADLTDVAITSPTNGQILQYNSTSGDWENAAAPSGAVWGSITGTLSDQTDLQAALDAKYDASNPSGFITGVDWGDIGGTLADQTDLNTALTDKLSKAANLADLPSLSTAITNLGLNAGGVNDIWVEKAGDTMTGDLTLSTGTQILADAASSSSPTYSFNGYSDTGVTRQTISSANRVVLVADGTNTVEYGATGALTRVPFLFSRQDVAWGASTVDGGIKNVYESGIGDDVTRMWPNRDFNAIVICDFGDRNRDTFHNVWTNDDQPGFLFWGSQTPNATNYHKYMFVGTDHDQGFSRIDTGNKWDLHFRQGQDVIFYSKANSANIAAARDDYFERAEGVVDSSIIFTDSASTTAVNVKLTENHHWWDSKAANIIYTLPDLKNVPIGWRIRFSDYRGTCSTNAVRIAGFSTQVIYSGILSIAGSNTYDITTDYRGLELQNIDGKAWYVICVS